MKFAVLTKVAVASVALIAGASAFAANPALSLVSGTGSLALDPSAASQLGSVSLTLGALPGSTTDASLTQPVSGFTANAANTALTNISFAGAGLQLYSSTLSIEVTNFVLNASNNTISASLGLTGSSKTTYELFKADSLTGSFNVGTLSAGQIGNVNLTLNDLHLTSAGANAVAALAGYAGFGFALVGINFGDFNTAVTLQAAAVPEPSTYALMGLGLGVAGLLARRRAATQAAA